MLKLEKTVQELNMEDLKIKLSATAQNELNGNIVSFTAEMFNLGTDESIVRNSVLSSDRKVQILNAKQSIKNKRSEMKQLKAKDGILFDKRSFEENIFESSTKMEQSVLDANIMYTMKEKAYRLWTIVPNIVELNENGTPKEMMYALQSIECTKTGYSKPKTVAIANINRNYVKISDFVVLKDSEADKAIQKLDGIFRKWSLTKENVQNWKDCVFSIQSELKEYENTEFGTVMKWIELNQD